MMNVPALIRLTKFPALTGIGEASIITGSRLFRLESFVRFPLPQFTTFLLVMHMAFGCCMHHAHACEVNCCSEPAVSAEACPCGTHRDEELAEVSQDGVGHDAEGDGHDHDSGGKTGGGILWKIVSGVLGLIVVGQALAKRGGPAKETTPAVEPVK